LKTNTKPNGTVLSLRSRRRKRGEKLQDVYTDIRRLMSFAYPGPTNETSEIVARDAFLDALGNRSLRVRILEHEPSNLDDALRTALRLEAIDKAGLDETDDERGRNRIKMFGLSPAVVRSRHVPNLHRT
jgi:hypothetical protein